jgi:hypothetical protein
VILGRNEEGGKHTPVDKNWRVVTHGLEAILAGWFGFLLACLLLVFAHAPAANWPFRWGRPMVEWLGVFAVGVSPLLLLGGRGACCWMPVQSQARGPAVVSTAFAVGPCLTAVGSCFTAALRLVLGQRLPLALPIALALSAAAALGSEVSFVWCIKRLGTYLNDDGIRARVGSLLDRLLYFALACLAASVAGVAWFGWQGEALVVLGCIGAPFLLFALPGTYLALLFNARAAILRRGLTRPPLIDLDGSLDIRGGP